MKKEDKGKTLYTCESEITAHEYGEMCTVFSVFYWYYAAYGTVLSIIIAILLCLIGEGDFSTGIVLFIIIEIMMLVVYKIRLKTMAETGFLKMQKKKPIDTHYTTEFYEDYLIRKGKSKTRKIEYKQIIKTIETNTNFYIKIPKGIIVIQKNKCELDLNEFIRNKFADNLDKRIIKKKQIKYRDPQFIGGILIALFIITILSLWGALLTWGLIGTIKNSFGFDLFKDMWIFWLWLPIPILSIVLGFKYKKQGIKCTKNIVAGFIVGTLLTIYGCFSFIFSDLSDFTNSIFVITQDEYNNEIKYYEVNDKEQVRKIAEFQSEVNEIYTIDGCFDVMNENQLTLENCEIKDKNKKDIEVNELFKNILIDINTKEDSWILQVKVLETNEKYYVVTTLNVNLWTPYVLYQYNFDKKELEYIYTFSNENIIGIKLK